MLYEHDLVFRLEEPKEPVDWMDPLAFLFHDNGSNENEVLKRLEPYIHPNFRIISVRAPFKISDDKYAWTVTDDFSKIESNDFNIMMNRLHKFVKFAFGNHHTGLATIIAYSEGIAGTLNLSDKLVNGSFYDELIVVGSPYIDAAFPLSEKAHSYYDSVFITHGLQDDIISIDQGRRIWERINELGLKPDLHYHEYNMGHTPSEECLTDIKKYIGRPHKGYYD